MTSKPRLEYDVTEAFADALSVGDLFALTFLTKQDVDLTAVLDLPTLQSLQMQIAALISPEPQTIHRR
ncbi:hypothetical protein [Methylocystis sp.]|uniref:hypothetical protein n=1 Tax=Methylocystis sp. TaxID=1911079 RepID=UPI003DA320FB